MVKIEEIFRQDRVLVTLADVPFETYSTLGGFWYSPRACVNSRGLHSTLISTPTLHPHATPAANILHAGLGAGISQVAQSYVIGPGQAQQVQGMEPAPAVSAGPEPGTASPPPPPPSALALQFTVVKSVARQSVALLGASTLLRCLADHGLAGILGFTASDAGASDSAVPLTLTDADRMALGVQVLNRCADAALCLVHDGQNLVGLLCRTEPRAHVATISEPAWFEMPIKVVGYGGALFSLAQDVRLIGAMSRFRGRGRGQAEGLKAAVTRHADATRNPLAALLVHATTKDVAETSVYLHETVLAGRALGLRDGHVGAMLAGGALLHLGALAHGNGWDLTRAQRGVCTTGGLSCVVSSVQGLLHSLMGAAREGSGRGVRGPHAEVTDSAEQAQGEESRVEAEAARHREDVRKRLGQSIRDSVARDLVLVGMHQLMLVPTDNILASRLRLAGLLIGTVGGEVIKLIGTVFGGKWRRAHRAHEADRESSVDEDAGALRLRFIERIRRDERRKMQLQFNAELARMRMNGMNGGAGQATPSRMRRSEPVARPANRTRRPSPPPEIQFE